MEQDFNPTIQTYSESSTRGTHPKNERSSNCHPTGFWQRFIVVLFSGYLGFTAFFCTDNPAALMDSFLDDLGLTTTQFTMLYSFTAWPNVVLSFVGGFLLDKVFGIRLGTVFYTFLMLLGQIIFAIGVFYNYFIVMVIGRFIFGSGSELMTIALIKYSIIWFKDSEIILVFGLQLSLTYLGSAVNFWCMEPLNKWVHQFYKGPEALGVIIFITTMVCVLSLICALTLAWIDKRAEQVLRRKTTNNLEERVRLADIKEFPITLWLICLVCVTFFVSISPFIAISKNFFIEKFKMEPVEADTVNSLVFVIAAIVVPIFGFIIDKIGRNLIVAVTIILTALGGLLILDFSDWNPYIGMTLLGVAYATFICGSWPLIAMVIPDHQFGTACGIKQSSLNLGLAIVPLISGVILDGSNYYWTIMFFIGTLTMSLLATLLLWRIDNKKQGVLNMSSKQRAIKQEQFS